MINLAGINKRIENRINIHSLKTRLIVSILLLFLILIIVLIMNNIVAVNIVTKKTNESIINSIRQTNNYVALLLKKAKDSSLAISMNESMVNYSNRNWSKGSNDYESFTLTKELDDLMISSIGMTNEIISIFIYFESNNKLIVSNKGIYSFDEVKDSTWFKKAREINRPFSWIGYFYDESFNNKNLISLVTRADIINKKIKSKVYVGINFDETSINTVIKSIGITPNSKIYMLDENQRIISAQNKRLLGKQLKKIVNADTNLLEDFKTLKANDGKYYQMVYQKNPYVDWGILTSIPKNELLKEQRIFWDVILGVIIIISFIIIVGTYRIVSSIVDKPVNKLIKMMRQVETGNFSHQIGEVRKDEFGYLYESYNKMVSRTGQLIKELYEEKLLKKESELRALQSQINPHFLYNTLECINWIAKVNKVEEISNIVVALSNLYRATFNQGEDFARVADVKQALDNYLFIQKFRFGNKFDYIIEVDSEADNILMPNLLLQPIVENAVLYGVGECSRKGQIDITISLEDNLMYMVVKDNGAGMSFEKQDILRRSINRKGNIGGSAMKNIQKRIELFYGTEYGLTFESYKDQGTTVTIKIPYFNYIDRET